MVYRGKPSPACALCRVRRLRCDRGQPSCSQCLRVQKPCSGYQDPEALRIYDQTKEITSKARTRATAAQRAAPQRTIQNTHTVDSTALPLISWPASIQEQAISHTFRYYVGTHQHRGLLSYLPELLNTNPSEALQATVKAIGLACMARIHRLPKLRRSAGEEYSIALRATNKDLQNAVTAISDSTLATVVLLSMYEIITCQETDIMGPWLNHVHGAIKLLELRGKQQFQSPAGLELFTIVRLQSAMSNLFYRTNCHNSPTIATLSEIARTLCDPDSQAIEDFYDILIPLNDLSIAINAAYDENHFQGNIGPLIGKALRLDADLAAWAVSLGPSWYYTIVAESASLPRGTVDFPILEGQYHIYPNLNVATFWNHYRQARIALNEMIRTMCLSTLGRQDMPEASQIMLQSIAVNKQLATDVCASVPYYFRSEEANLGGVARLPWPLFVAADCVGPSDDTKSWILQILDIISKATGVQQPRVLSYLIKHGHRLPLIPGKCYNY